MKKDFYLNGKLTWITRNEEGYSISELKQSGTLRKRNSIKRNKRNNNNQLIMEKI